MADMTVRRLIAELRKMPQDARVAWRDQDQSINEINDFVRGVEEAGRELLEEKSHCKAIVVLHP